MNSDGPTQPKARDGDIPAELSFEEVIKNRTAPPCSLNDFMDYLLYVERDAESLQFFLWYWDYTQRWGNLLPRQKALSPPWDPEQGAEPQSRFIKYSQWRERSHKMSKVLAIMDLGSERAAAESLSRSASRSSSSGASQPPATPASISSTTILSPTEPTHPPDWQPFTIPPNRDELTRITRHYLHRTAPRRLRLPPRDRDASLRAAQHTTHPSALLPAFAAVEAALRTRAHPAFARWARANAGPARLRFVRALAALALALALAADVLLVLSRLPAYCRAACLVLWWPALTVLGAAAGGVCVVLHWKGRRQVRPWEVEVEVGGFEGEGGDGKGSEGDGSGGDGLVEEGWREHKRSGTEGSAGSGGSGESAGSGCGRAGGADPLRKPCLQVFGPRNDFSGEAWVGAYEARGWWRKVFEETVPVQNRALVAWQDRTVFLSVIWGAAGATALTVVSLFVPSGGLF